MAKKIRFSRYLKCLLVLFLTLPFVSEAETILSFDSDITLSQDSSFQVREKIEYFFDEPRHGIFRNIPTTHPLKDPSFLKKRRTEIKVDSVLLDGEMVPYTIDNSAREINIKIGDPDKTIHGSYIYEIVYIVEGGLSYFDSGAVDLYWNITGNDWPVPIEKATARISSEADIFLETRTCYEGVPGAGQVCQITVNNPQEIIFSSTNLDIGEGLTIAQEIAGDKIEKVELISLRLGFVLLPFLVLIVIYSAWRLYKFEIKHKTGRTIIPEYEPYPGVKPMYTGLVFDNNLETRDITAGIVYLAEQGYLKIRKTEKKVLFIFEVDDYELTIMKDVEGSVSSSERKILELLFGDNLTVGTVVTLSDLKNNTTKQTKNLEILSSLKAELKADLHEDGFYEKGLQGRQNLVRNLLIVITLGVIIAYLLGPVVIVFIIALVVGGIVAYERRTRKGYEALDHLKGFKLFLEVTDKERFDFHNAPEKSPELFMEYLPYAIAFGVEEKWAKVFEGIAIENPSWYDGGSVGAFSAVNLTSSMNAFSTALASSASSASSGGGSSGGGGGGGGGGSW